MQVLMKIRELRLCSAMGQAMRAAQRDAKQREETEKEKSYRYAHVHARACVPQDCSYRDMMTVW